MSRDRGTDGELGHRVRNMAFLSPTPPEQARLERRALAFGDVITGYQPRLRELEEKLDSPATDLGASASMSFSQYWISSENSYYSSGSGSGHMFGGSNSGISDDGLLDTSNPHLGSARPTDYPPDVFFQPRYHAPFPASFPNRQQVTSPFASDVSGSRTRHRFPTVYQSHEHDSVLLTVSHPFAAFGIDPGLKHFASPQDEQTARELKRRRRRESHNLVERRRRDNINERIQDLSKFVPAHRLEDEKIRRALQSGMSLPPTSAHTNPSRAEPVAAKENKKCSDKGDMRNDAASRARELTWAMHILLHDQDQLLNDLRDRPSMQTPKRDTTCFDLPLPRTTDPWFGVGLKGSPSADPARRVHHHDRCSSCKVEKIMPSAPDIPRTVDVNFRTVIAASTDELSVFPQLLRQGGPTPELDTDAYAPFLNDPGQAGVLAGTEGYLSLTEYGRLAKLLKSDGVPTKDNDEDGTSIMDGGINDDGIIMPEYRNYEELEVDSVARVRFADLWFLFQTGGLVYRRVKGKLPDRRDSRTGKHTWKAHKIVSVPERVAVSATDDTEIRDLAVGNDESAFALERQSYGIKNDGINPNSSACSSAMISPVCGDPNAMRWWSFATSWTTVKTLLRQLPGAISAAQGGMAGRLLVTVQ